MSSERKKINMPQICLLQLSTKEKQAYHRWIMLDFPNQLSFFLRNMPILRERTKKTALSFVYS